MEAMNVKDGKTAFSLLKIMREIQSTSNNKSYEILNSSGPMASPLDRFIFTRASNFIILRLDKSQ
jgi:hypothetical protein